MILMNEQDKRRYPIYSAAGRNLRQDRERYQTVYARMNAAPSPRPAARPSLHAWKSVPLPGLRGASVVEVTLHVGYGTFEPVRGRRYRGSTAWRLECSHITDEAANDDQ